MLLSPRVGKFRNVINPTFSLGKHECKHKQGAIIKQETRVPQCTNCQSNNIKVYLEEKKTKKRKNLSNYITHPSIVKKSGIINVRVREKGKERKGENRG